MVTGSRVTAPASFAGTWSTSIEQNIDDMMGLYRTLGFIQWKELGRSADNSAASWLGAVDRARQATRSDDLKQALEHIKLAQQIESEFPKFKALANQVIEALEEVIRCRQ